MAGYRFLLRSCICLSVLLVIMVYIGFMAYSQPSSETELERSMRDRVIEDQDYDQYKRHQREFVTAKPHDFASSQDIPYPIIMWWTPFTLEPGRVKACGDVSCFFTNDRKYAKHPNMKVFMFYGTNFNHTDLPLPRQRHHEWALLHEEAPHNQYMFSHGNAMELFNHSCTFRRESHYPISTQWLQSISDLETKKYMATTAEKTKQHREGTLALVNYVQSDCGALSDRDRVVTMLQRHLKVDSYGRCLHNKDLPEHLSDPLKGMEHKDFYHLIGRYKFTLAMENGVCDDYMTEKFWRPFIAGSVPIIFGSPKAKEFLPRNKSAIMLSDFKNIEELVQLIKYLDENEEQYNEYLEHKQSGVDNPMLRELMQRREWGIGDDYHSPHYSQLIQAYECFICRRLHENIARTKKQMVPHMYHVSEEHYGCPRPKKFADVPPGSLESIDDEHWASAWVTGKHMARVLKEFVIKNKPGYTEKEFFDNVIKYFTRDT